MKKKVRAEILAIGDELLYGQVRDTNSHWISLQLADIGVSVVRRTTVGDDEESMMEAFRQAESNADIVLITGGLGPTSDDLTKPLLSSYFGCGMALVPEALDAVKAYFERRGRELTDTNIQQAYLPTKCEYVSNPVGTAPGMWFHENGCYWMSMPGVPHEMERMMVDFVIPRIKKLFELPVIHHQMVRTVGIGESWLSDRTKDWEQNLPTNIKLAYLPFPGEVHLRLTAVADTGEIAKNSVEIQLKTLVPLIGDYIYSLDQEPLQVVVGRLLKERMQTVAFAESCTGGYIAHLITSVGGSSDYFNGGIIPYHNDFKASVLGVLPDTLNEFGAVSENTVIEMAQQVRKKFSSSYGVASSGIAGPGGGSAEKPVGTVWIACATEDGVFTKLLRLTEERMLNIRLTGIGALNLLRQCILK